jgi:hypothetical protein
VQLQDLLQRLSGAQQLVQRVLDLETTNSQQTASITSLQQQLLSSEQQVQDLSTQLAAWQVRGSRAEQQLAAAQQQLTASTPRPKRELGLLTDLLTAAEAQLVEQALITGGQHACCCVDVVWCAVEGLEAGWMLPAAILTSHHNWSDLIGACGQSCCEGTSGTAGVACCKASNTVAPNILRPHR